MWYFYPPGRYFSIHYYASDQGLREHSNIQGLDFKHNRKHIYKTYTQTHNREHNIYVRGLLGCYLEDEEPTSELVASSLTVIKTQVFFDGREVGHGGYYRVSRRGDTGGLVFKDIYCYSRLNTIVPLYTHNIIKVHAMVAARLTVSLSLTTCGVCNPVFIEGHKRLLSTRSRQWRPVDLWSLAASAYLEWWRCGVLLQCCVASAMHGLCWWSFLSLVWRPRVERLSRVPCAHGLGVRTAWHRIVC